MEFVIGTIDRMWNTVDTFVRRTTFVPVVTPIARPDHAVNYEEVV